MTRIPNSLDRLKKGKPVTTETTPKRTRRRNPRKGTQEETLAGKAWTNAQGETWKVDSVSNLAGNEQAIIQCPAQEVWSTMTPDQVRAAMASATVVFDWQDQDPEQAEGETAIPADLTAPIDEMLEDVTAEVDGLADDVAQATEELPPEVAAGGSQADAQYRRRQLLDDEGEEGASNPIRIQGIDGGRLLARANSRIRELDEEITRRGGGKGYVTVKVTIGDSKEDDRERNVDYVIDMKLPPVKAKSCYWTGDDILPGLPKRDIDAQLTVTDAANDVEAEPIPQPEPESTASEETPTAEDFDLSLDDDQEHDQGDDTPPNHSGALSDEELAAAEEAGAVA